MKDRSKKLLVINTGKKGDQEGVYSASAKPSVAGGSGMASPGNLSDYLLKSIWDRVWEIKTDSQGNEYIFGKLPVVTQYGITMYADGGELNLPSIYAGIPFDNKTIWLNPKTKKVEVIGGTGGGVADSVHWNNIEGKPSFSAVATSGKYADLNGLPDLNVYATTEYLTAELKKYVTLNTEQTIGAHKDFLNGLSIGGLPITKSQDDVIYLDANLVVRGGITMYAEGEVNIPSIIDSLPIASTTAKGIASFDGTYFAVDSNGKVTLLAANVGLNEDELAAYLTEKKYATQSWVYSLGYASSSDLNALQTKVNDFLEGSDTDTIINKWKELESFLSGLSESDNLATILGTKANQSDLDDTNDVVATKWTQDDIKIGNWDTAYKWGDHSKVGYALKSYVDDTFVTLATKQPITGEKNFTGGLKVNGSPIVYDATNKYWKLEGDLLVTGGVTMYASDSAFTPSTIMNGVVVDGVTIGKRASDGALYFMGETGGGLTEVYWNDIKLKPTFASVATSGKYSDLSGRPTLLSSFTDDVVSGKYLPLSGGDINGDVNIYGNPQSINKNGMMIFHNLSLNQGGIFKYKGGDNWTVSNSGGTTECTILHSNNWSQFVTAGDGGNYLPLSGGTISGGFGVLTVERNEPWACSIEYKNTSSILGYIGFDDDFKAKIWDRNKSNAKVIAFESSNVASATKLQTARTIWGQSFDGAGDVNGTIYVKVSSGHITADLKSASSSQSVLAYTKSNGITWSTGVGVRDGGDSFGFWSTTSQLCVLSIDISGNVLSQGGITMYSDIRKKTKLQDVELTLQQIAEAPLIEHYYNSDINKTTHVGSIAQYWAGINDWFCKLDSEGFYTMEIQNAALASAISIARELVKYESKTDRKIRLLKQRVKELEEKIEKLENN